MRYLVLLLLLPFSLNAQQNSGRIIYEETRKLEITLGNEMMEEVKAMLPKSQTAQRMLIFNDAASLYEDYEKDESEDQNMNMTSEDGQGVRLMIMRPDNKVYRNIEKGMVTEKREFMGKNFLVAGDKEGRDWKFTGKSKEILGYMCQQVTVEDTTGVTEVWFTPQIAVATGPDNFGGLPGLVLEVGESEGKRIITATDISLVEVAATEIKEPKKGKKVSREEFNAIVKEKMAEMKDINGGQMRFIQKH